MPSFPLRRAALAVLLAAAPAAASRVVSPAAAGRLARSISGATQPGSALLSRLEPSAVSAWASVGLLDPGSREDRLVLSALALNLPAGFERALDAAAAGDAAGAEETLFLLEDARRLAHEELAARVRGEYEGLLDAGSSGEVSAEELEAELADMARRYAVLGPEVSAPLLAAQRRVRMERATLSAAAIGRELLGELGDFERAGLERGVELPRRDPAFFEPTKAERDQAARIDPGSDVAALKADPVLLRWFAKADEERSQEEAVYYERLPRWSDFPAGRPATAGLAALAAYWSAPEGAEQPSVAFTRDRITVFASVKGRFVRLMTVDASPRADGSLRAASALPDFAERMRAKGLEAVLLGPAYEGSLYRIGPSVVEPRAERPDPRLSLSRPSEPYRHGPRTLHGVAAAALPVAAVAGPPFLNVTLFIVVVAGLLGAAAGALVAGALAVVVLANALGNYEKPAVRLGALLAAGAGAAGGAWAAVELALRFVGA